MSILMSRHLYVELKNWSYKKTINLSLQWYYGSHKLQLLHQNSKVYIGGMGGLKY